MTYSKTHKRFSERLNQPAALTDPAKYLGPNYQDVLNFWIYLDNLSDEEKKEMGQRYRDLNDNVRWSAIDAARDAADEVVGWEFRYAAWNVALNVTGRWVFSRATVELIAHHKLLEQNKTLTFLPLCVNN
jgi:hypothetical protein